MFDLKGTTEMVSMTDEKKVRVLAWVNALRSGNYKATKNCLRDEKGFCCLGVLCDLTEPNNWADPSEVNGPIDYDGLHDTTPPTWVRQTVNMIGKEGRFVPEFLPKELQERISRHYPGNGQSNKNPYTLAGLNDFFVKAGADPFPVIADLIEYALDKPEVGLFWQGDISRVYD
jgi:hypothetical protein